MRIGIDFDNTIADYDRVFPRVAGELGLLADGFDGDKAAVRDALRQRANGEEDWQRLQGQVYGRHMPLARPMPGVQDFFETCLERHAKVLVISHKTAFGHFDPAKVNLRTAAMTWLDDNGFFDPVRSPLTPDDVAFEATRAEKASRIAVANVDHFIDDLAEVFAEPGFPAATRRHLYGANGHAHWDNIREAIFGA